MARDYYDVLGVSRSASSDEFQEAYRRLARRYHPDVNKSPDAEERFKELNEAYHVLSDPQARQRYDRMGASAGAGPQEGEPFPFGAGWTTVDDRGTDLDDLLGSMFGGFGGARAGGARARRPGRGADQEAIIELSVEEAYRGGRQRLTLDGRSLEVDIPPGVLDGQRIRLAGQGEPGRGGPGRGDGGPAGDLYLVVRIAPHPRYRLDGRDIHVDLPVAPWEAALGATVRIQTPGGEVEVKVPPGSSSGRRLRLRGRGMPNPRGAPGDPYAAPGDLYAKVRIMVPARLSPRERELFRELAKVSGFDPRKARR